MNLIIIIYSKKKKKKTINYQWCPAIDTIFTMIYTAMLYIYKHMKQCLHHSCKWMKQAQTIEILTKPSKCKALLLEFFSPELSGL